MYDEIKPDIRRTIKSERERFTGLEIIDAVKQVALELGRQYKEQIIRDNNREKTYHVGIGSKHPCEAIIIRTGEWLENKDIQINMPYQRIGVGSTDWPGAEYNTIGVHDVAQLVTEAVENVRDRLEEKLI